jgi:Protein of unknown function (DUF1302)
MKKQAATSPGIRLSGAVRATLALAALGVATSASAVDFQNAAGTVTGSLDTTISFGNAWRLGNPNPALVGAADGGTGTSPNIDNGDANYKKGDLFSSAMKITSELSLKYRNYGFFARGSGLYDMQVMDAKTLHSPISQAAKDQAGSYVRLLDAFGFGKWEMGDGHPVELRVGKQVVNWGESTFIQNGLTGVNPVDVSALRVPGAEIKEAYVPQQMIKASLGTTENTSIEAFYMLDWRRTEPEPDGTYFSTNDFAAAGGHGVFLGFGSLSDQGTDFRPLGGPFITNFQNVTEGPRIDPNKDGQFGVAFRWFLPNFGSGTEISFYYMNYASHLPLISGRAGTLQGIANAAGAATAVEAAAQAMVAGLPESAAINVATAVAAQAATAQGGNVSAATLHGYATIGANTYLGGGNLAAQANSLATHEFAQTASYFEEYPANLQTFAVGFNTQLGTSGIALQGEVEYRRDTPLQFDDVELLFAALTPLEQALFPLSNPGQMFPDSCSPLAPTLSRCGQLGAFAPGATIRGWGRYDVWQAQATATKAFPPVLGAQQLSVVLEAGVTDIPNLPDKTTGGPNGQGLRFEVAGTNLSGNPLLAPYQLGKVQPLNTFADRLSWGYRLAAKLDYPNLIGSWNLSPRLVWQQDVKGTTPGPGGNFIEGRQALSLGVTANYQNRWELGADYSRFGGGGLINLLSDRDFAAVTIKYSF